MDRIRDMRTNVRILTKTKAYIMFQVSVRWYVHRSTNTDHGQINIDHGVLFKPVAEGRVGLGGHAPPWGQFLYEGKWGTLMKRGILVACPPPMEICQRRAWYCSIHIPEGWMYVERERLW